MPFEKRIRGYVIRPATRGFKKYSVYKDGKHVTSFGDKRYQHYHDRIGYYSSKNHHDRKRRANYRSRHRNDKITDPTKAGYWAYHYLW